MDLLASITMGTGTVWVKEYLVRFHVPLPSPDASSPTSYGAGLVDDVDEGFNHPFLITQLTVSGLSLILGVLWLRGGLDYSSRVSQASPFHLDLAEVPPRVYLYCALLFYCSSVLVNMNYAVLSGSVIQMLRGSKVVFTYILSVYVLEKRMHPYHTVGAMLCICACTVVGLREMGDSSGLEVLHREAAVAVTLCMISEVLRSVLFVYQEQSMRGYQIPPIKLAGIQGAIGILIGVVATSIAYLAGIEDVPRAFSKLAQSPQLDLVAFMLLAVSALWEVSGSIVTKRYSAVARTMLELSRTMSMWLIDLCFGYELFSMYHVFALVLLILGIAIYQHVLVIPLLEPQSEDASEEKPLKIAIMSQRSSH